MPRKGKARMPEPWWTFTTTEPAGRYGPRQCSLGRLHGLINHLSQAKWKFLSLRTFREVQKCLSSQLPIVPQPRAVCPREYHQLGWNIPPALQVPYHSGGERVHPLLLAVCTVKCLWSLWILYHVVTRQHLWLRLGLLPTYRWDSECLYLGGVKTKNIFSQTYHESSSPGMACWLLLDSGRFFLEPDPSFTLESPTLGFLVLDE